MSVIVPYNRDRAVEYAKKHAFVRDGGFFDFTDFGGNCTAFISQCLFYANGIMNPLPLGWYYYSSHRRSPSWTGVEIFYNFMTTNNYLGPFAKVSNVKDVTVGDLVQLKFYGYKNFTHTLMITKITDAGAMQSEKNMYLTGNTYDVLNRNMTTYHYKEARFLKVQGVYADKI